MKLFHEGVAVFQGQVIHHFDKNGKQTRVTGDLPSIPEGLGSGPVNLSETQAREKARERCKEPLRSETAERVVVRADDGKYHAAWNVKLFKSNRTEADGEARDVAYLVDANTGEFLKVGHKDEWEPYSPASHEENANTSAHSSQSDPSGRAKKRSVPVKASGHTQYSGPVDFIAARKADDTYKLKDSTRNIVTYDAENKSFDRQRYGSKEGKKAFIGKKHDPWDDSKTNNYTQVALDVHYGTQMMYDFMKDVLGRDSIDGKGGKLISHVHVNEGDGTPFKQAMWLDDRMVYGDGDGVKTKSYTPVEIVGHELTHGLNMHTANMVGGGETAALNESISDIMGAGLKWYVSQRNPEVKFNWKNGEKVIGPDWDVEALRHMDTPKKGERLNGQKGYVDHLDGFKPEGYVYFNTGIASNAFYLLAEGGKNSTSGLGVEGGIGMERALKIFGRALITEMRPNEDFQGARRATLQAATDLYGADSVEVRKLGEAWTAVGVKASS